MSGPVFLGIDLGTSGATSALVDLDAKVLGISSVEYETHYAQPGWAEQNPDDWWSAVISTIRQLGQNQDLSVVAGISVSSQAPTLLALDKSLKPVRPALIWMDRRATPQAEALGELHPGGSYVTARGNRPDAFFVAPKIAWMRDVEPDKFSRVAMFAQINGYINLLLTGNLTLDEQHASLMALRPAGSKEWDTQALEEVGIGSHQLPRVHPAIEVIGTVSKTASDLTGLPVGVPVIAGTVDGSAAGVETGVFQEGSAAEMAGSSSVIVMPTKIPSAHPAFITMSAPDGTSWHHLAAVVASGASLKWLRGIVSPSSDYSELTGLAGQSPPGAGGVLFVPHMVGERSPLWDSDRRGSLTGLTLGSTTSELVRAVLEGTAYSMRHNLEIAQELGIFPSELRSTGSPTISDLWCQIKADITGIPVTRMKNPTGAAFGDAVLAAVGTGAVESIEAFGAGLDRVDKQFEPTLDSALKDVYERGFEAYLETIAALTPRGSGGDRG